MCAVKTLSVFLLLLAVGALAAVARNTGEPVKQSTTISAVVLVVDSDGGSEWG